MNNEIVTVLARLDTIQKNLKDAEKQISEIYDTLIREENKFIYKPGEDTMSDFRNDLQEYLNSFLEKKQETSAKNWVDGLTKTDVDKIKAEAEDMLKHEKDKKTKVDEDYLNEIKNRNEEYSEKFSECIDDDECDEDYIQKLFDGSDMDVDKIPDWALATIISNLWSKGGYILCNNGKLSIHMKD